MEVLTAMERSETDDEDRPVREITIKGGPIFVNPYKDEEEAERKQAEEERIKVPYACLSNCSCKASSQHCRCCLGQCTS